MKLSLLLFLFLMWGAEGARPPLDRALGALERGLAFMAEKVEEINLDGVLGTRLVQSQLTALLNFRPMPNPLRSRIASLRDTAKRVSDRGTVNVYEHEPEYSRNLGRIMNEPRRLLWYPAVETREWVSPLPCSDASFNETASDECLIAVIGRSDEPPDPCKIVPACKIQMTSQRLRGYTLTHQVLYWQMLEMHGCVNDVPFELRMRLCSDVMRDAKEIVGAEYPSDHRDLFAEQVGLCGMWGFGDFARPDWLSDILGWQKPNGCFGDRHKNVCRDKLEPDRKREKRREKVLEGGCLSHKTTVSLLAIAANIRFLAERLEDSSKQEINDGATANILSKTILLWATVFNLLAYGFIKFPLV